MARKKPEAEQEFEDLSSYSSAKEYRRHRGAKRLFTPRRILGLALCVLMIVGGGAMMALSMRLESFPMTTAITKDPDKLGIAPAVTSVEGVRNIAVFGVDDRENAFSGPSDMIVILSVDENHEKIKVASVLRDSRVHIEGTSLNGEHVDWETAVGEAYQLGGPELAIRTLNTNFSLDIRDYITVNFAVLAQLIDAVGGVDVRLTAEEVREINVNLMTLADEILAEQTRDELAGDAGRKTYPVILQTDYFPDASGTVNVRSGNYAGGLFHLNGNQAVAYGRILSVDSDSVRADRHQVVVGQLLKVLRERGEIRDVAELALSSCRTSLTLDTVANLLPFLTASPAVESVTLPDSYYEEGAAEEIGPDGSMLQVYNLAQAAQRLNAFIYEENSPYWETYGDTGRNGNRESSSD